MLQVSASSVRQLTSSLGTSIQQAGEQDSGPLEDLLLQYAPLLHPSHYHVVSIKTALAQVIANNILAVLFHISQSCKLATQYLVGINLILNWNGNIRLNDIQQSQACKGLMVYLCRLTRIFGND